MEATISRVSDLIMMMSSLASSIDQWVDYVNSSVSPLSNQLAQLVFGHEQSDMKSYSILLNQFKKAL